MCLINLSDNGYSKVDLVNLPQQKNVAAYVAIWILARFSLKGTTVRRVDRRRSWIIGAIIRFIGYTSIDIVARVFLRSDRCATHRKIVRCVHVLGVQRTAHQIIFDRRRMNFQEFNTRTTAADKIADPSFLNFQLSMSEMR